MSTDNNDSIEGDLDSSSVDARVSEITEQYLDQLIRGDSPNRDRLVTEHPELAPDLESRLRLIDSLYRAVSRDADSPASDEEDSQISLSVSAQTATRMRCPHCGNKLQLVQMQQPLAEITCDGCGSTVIVDTEATRSQIETAELPEKIGRFPIVSLLGQGGFGVVYRGWDEALARYVAIKVPRSGYFSSLSERQRFMREARNAGQLTHPCIVKVHDVAETSKGGFPFIVSDFIEGLTLSDLIETRRLNFRESAELMMQTVEAIEHAHQHNIIHRDIKPSNILVDSGLKPNVTDFGLARDSSAEIAITMDGEVLGTPAYMAPEQARGEIEKVDSRSDVYSLGVVMFRLLSGELPFRGSRRMLLHQVLNDEPPLPRKINEHIPRDLETITLKAIRKEPHHRYQTAQELANDLRRWLNNEPIRARRIGVPGRLVCWCRRRPLVASLSAVIAGLIALSVALSVIWAVRETGLRKKEQASAAAARENEKISLERLSGLQVANGLRQMEQNRYFDALVWLTEALKNEPAEDKWAHRIRTGMISDQCPTLTGAWHQGQRVSRLLYFSDGTKFVACGRDVVSIYRTDSPTEPPVRLINPEPVFDMRLSPDDRWLLTRGDKRCFLWSLESGRRVAQLEHSEVVAGFDFSADSQQVVTTAHDSTARIWNLQGLAQQTFQHSGKSVTQATFSDDGKRLLTVSKGTPADPGFAHVWNLESGDELHKFRHDGIIYDARFNAAGDRVATASDDRTARIWNVDDGQPVGEEMPHGASVIQVHWIDGNNLATVARDGSFNRWNNAGAKIEPAFSARATPITSSVDPQKHWAAIAANDGFVHAFWLRWGTVVCCLIPCGETATALAIHPDGRNLIAASERGVIKSWDLAGITIGEIELPHQQAVNQAHFSPGGDRVITASDDGTSRLWQTEDGSGIGAVMKHDDVLFDVKFDRTGQFAVTASLDATAQVWDANSGIALGPRFEHGEPLVRVAVHPDADRVLTADTTGMVKAWTYQNETPDFELNHGDQVNSVRFSPDGMLIATASSDQTARLWDAETGRPHLTPVRHEDRVTFCEFSPDGSWLATCGRDRVVRLASTTNDDEKILRHSGAVSSARFASDGLQLATTDYQGNARIWSLEAGRVVHQLSRPGFLFNFADFHPQQSVLAIAGSFRDSRDLMPRGGVVYLWDFSTGNLLGPPLPHLGSARRVRFDATGNRFVSAADDGMARLWSLEPDQRSAESLGRLAALWSGRAVRDHRLSELEPAQQAAEFLSLRREHPDWFRCSSEAEDRWNQLVQRIASKEDDQ